MARGWESKAIEEQQSQAANPPSAIKPRPTPEQIARQLEEEGLLLSRKHILQQLKAAQNPRHRQVLEAALADLDAKLARRD